MKKLLFGLITCIPFISSAQDSVKVTGQIGKIGAPAKVYITYPVSGKQIVDSSSITSGWFSFKVPVSSPAKAKLALDHTGTTMSHLLTRNEINTWDKALDVMNFYIDKDNTTITGTDSLSTARIIGSAINDDHARLNTQLAPVNAKAKRLTDYAATLEISRERSPEFVATMQTRLKPIQAERERILQAFVINNPKSYISLVTLNELGTLTADAAILAPLYRGLSGELKETDLGKSLAADIELFKTTAIGATAPEFSQNDAAGKPIALSSFRGRYVLVDFWASWCEPCRAATPILLNTFNKYRTKKFAILGVSLDNADQKANWMKAVEDDGLRWPQVSDLKGWQNTAATLYNVKVLPQNVLIGPDGRIVARNLRGADLENKLAEIFGKI